MREKNSYIYFPHPAFAGASSEPLPLEEEIFRDSLVLENKH